MLLAESISMEPSLAKHILRERRCSWLTVKDEIGQATKIVHVQAYSFTSAPSLLRRAGLSTEWRSCCFL